MQGSGSKVLTGRSGHQTVMDRKHIRWLQQIGGHNYNLTSKTLKRADCFWAGGGGATVYKRFSN